MTPSKQDKEAGLTDSLQGILVGAVVTFIGNMFLRVSGLLERVLVARFFNPDKYGEFVLALTVLNFAVIVAVMGLDKGIVRYVARADDEQKRRGIVVFSLRFSFLIALVVGGILFVSAGAISNAVFNDATLTPFVRVAAVIVPFAVIVKIATATARGFESARARTLMKDIGLPGAKLLFIVITIFLGFDILGVASGYIAAYLVISIFALGYIWNLTGGRGTTSIRTELLRFSVPLLVTGSLRIVADTIDTLFIAAMLTTRDVGVYNAGYMLSNLVLMAPTLVGVIFMPIMSDYHSQTDLKSMDRIFKLSTRWILALTTPGFVLILLSPGTFISSLFQETYLDATGVLLVVSSGFFLHVMLGLNGATLNMIGDSDFILFTSILNAATNIALNLVLIPRIGIIGAAIATFVSFSLSNVAAAIRLYQRVRILPFSWNTTVTVASLSLITVLISISVGYYLDGIIYILICYTASIIIFFPLYGRYLSIPEEQEIFTNKVREKIKQ